MSTSSIRQQLTCPLTGKLFENPVRINCEQEHAFERSVIEPKLKSEKSCPVCHTAAINVFEDKRLNDQLKTYRFQSAPLSEKNTQILTFENLLEDAHAIISFAENRNAEKPLEAINHLNRHLKVSAVDLLQRLAVQLSKEEKIPKFFIGVGLLKYDFDIEPYTAFTSVRILAKSLHSNDFPIPPQGPMKEYIHKAKAGDPEAQFQVGMCYYKGDGVAPDYEQAVKWFRKSAKHGHAKSQYYLGLCYFKGHGIAKDFFMAFSWAQKAADQNDVLALYWLSYLYKHGFGAFQNRDMEDRYFNVAFEESQKLVKEGQAEGQYVAAMCYCYGRSSKQNFKLAAELFHQAASQKYGLAQYQLALLFFSGDGVDKNADIFIQKLELAAQNGVEEAQFLLGECYFYGDSVKKNRETGFTWYQEAAKRGVAAAQDRLYTCYKHGEGVCKNPMQAYYWFQKAANQGFIHERGGFTGIMDALSSINSVYFLM